MSVGSSRCVSLIRRRADVSAVKPVRVAFVCDGGAGVGWGHVGRGHALLEGTSASSALIVGSGFAQVSAWVRHRRLGLRVLPWCDVGTPLDPCGRHFDILIVDHYGLDSDWIAFAALAMPTFVIDDWMRERVVATGLVCPNVGASPVDWPDARVSTWVIGPRYALVRNEVRRLRGSAPRRRAHRLLVTLGGSDPDGRTAEVVDVLTTLPWYGRGGLITVVLGPSYAGDRPWERWGPERTGGLEIVRQPTDFVARCADADVVVCGAGTTTYEMAYLGRAFFPVALVDNQARIVAGWAALGVGEGLAVWQPEWRTILAARVERLLADAALRRTLSAAAARVVDGHGAARVLDACSRWLKGPGRAES